MHGKALANRLLWKFLGWPWGCQDSILLHRVPQSLPGHRQGVVSAASAQTQQTCGDRQCGDVLCIGCLDSLWPCSPPVYFHRWVLHHELHLLHQDLFSEAFPPLPGWPCSPTARKHPGVLPVHILNLAGSYTTWLFLCLPPRWHLPCWRVQTYSVRAGPYQKRQRRQKTSPSPELWAHLQR